MKEKEMRFNEMVYGDICQRSCHSMQVMDEDVEDFEQEILSALEEEE